MLTKEQKQKRLKLLKKLYQRRIKKLNHDTFYEAYQVNITDEIPSDVWLALRGYKKSKYL